MGDGLSQGTGVYGERHKIAPRYNKQIFQAVPPVRWTLQMHDRRQCVHRTRLKSSVEINMSEPKLETHEDGVNFAKEVFRSMGGTVLPPKRPHHIQKYTPLSVARDDFMMDF